MGAHIHVYNMALCVLVFYAVHIACLLFQVDVIISEWMVSGLSCTQPAHLSPPPLLPPPSQGYFLLFESMLDTVVFARDKWLADPANGVCVMVPSLSLQGGCLQWRLS